MYARDPQVATHRGRMNTVVMMAPVKSGETASLPAGLRQIRYVLVANPSARVWHCARGICPNLQILALDPVHLGMTCEYASSRKRTASSKILRGILRKFTAHSSARTPNSWGPVFTGGAFLALTREDDNRGYYFVPLVEHCSSYMTHFLKYK